MEKLFLKSLYRMYVVGLKMYDLVSMRWMNVPTCLRK